MSTPLVADLISDTVTRPTAAMRAAMAQAEVGDEQRGEDPTVRALEERMAALLGMASAVFVPSASMANQIAVQLHTGPGDEVVAHTTAHVINHEGGGLAANARAQCRPLQSPNGLFTAEQLADAIRVDDPHYPRTSLVVIENTSNGGGGTPWTPDQVRAVLAVARLRGLKAHLDGARFFNAVTVLGVEPRIVAQGFDSVTVCFSKGLGCPFGAVLCLTDGLAREARRAKQRLGGALRQSGIIAAAGLHALDHHVERLAEDHRRAAALHRALADLPRLTVEPVHTNLVFFRVQPDAEAAARFVKRLAARGVRVGITGGNRIRAVLHMDVTDEGLEAAIAACKEAVAAL
jgi:threonine aldolase